MDEIVFLGRKPPLILIALRVSLVILSKYGFMLRANPKTKEKFFDLVAVSIK